MTDVTELLAHPAAMWLVDALRARQPIDAAEVEKRFDPGFVEMAGADALADGLTRMAVGLQVIDAIVAEDAATLRIPLSATGGYTPFRLRVGLTSDRLAWFDFGPAEIEGIEIWTASPAELDAASRAKVHDLFDASYRSGDHTYLDDQLDRLGTIAVAWAEDRVVGFALSGAYVIDIPGRPGQVVRTAGLACISADQRRKGISARLESMAMAGGNVPAQEHTLLTSRLAHPAGLRHLAGVPNIVPRPGHTATQWQRDVAEAVAAVISPHGFARETFVCRGNGRPVGENLVDVDVSPELRALFDAVDRARGDTLLAVWWTTPPPDWDTT